MDREQLETLVGVYGKGYDIVAFAVGKHLVAIDTASMKTYELQGNIQEIILALCRRHSVRYIQYIGSNGEKVLPDLDEIAEYELSDY